MKNFCSFFLLGMLGFILFNADSFAHHRANTFESSSEAAKTNEYYRIKYFSPHTPTYSRPECPDNSAYHSSTGRCECFSGYYAPSSQNSSCRREKDGGELCRERFGRKARYNKNNLSCFCRKGFEFGVTRQGIQCVTDNEN